MAVSARRHTWSILMLGLAAVLALWLHLRNDEEMRARARFAKFHQSICEEAKRTMGDEVGSLWSLRDLFLYSEDVRSDEFQGMAEEILSRLPYVNAVEWLPRVNDRERIAWETRYLHDAIPGTPDQIFRLDSGGRPHPADTASEYFPIQYSVRRVASRDRLGGDFSIGPTWLAMARAVRQQQPTAIGWHPMQSAPDRSDWGYTFLLPVTRSKNREIGDTIGFVSVSIAVRAMFDDLLSTQLPTDVRIAISELGIDGTDTLIHAIVREGDGVTIARNRPHITLESGMTLTPSDKEWTVQTTVYAQAWHAALSYRPLIYTLIASGFYGVLAYWLRLIIQAQTSSRLTLATAEQARRELTEQQTALDAALLENKTQLAHTRNQLQRLVDQLPGVVFRVEFKPEARTTFIAGNTEQLTGQAPQELTSTPGGFINLIPPEDRTKVQHALNRAAFQQGPFEIEHRIRTAKGETRWLLTRGIGFSISETDIAVEGLSIDITERHDMEAEKIGMERRMLEGQKLESLGVLAGGIAHDFNNLLTGILGHTSMALSEEEHAHTPEETLRYIEHAAQRAADLCQQMLAYAGKGRFELQTFMIGDLLRDMRPLLETSIAKNVRLDFKMGGASAPISGDATQVRQIVMNLVINASDAIGRESGSIVIETKVTPIDASAFSTAVLSPNLPSARYACIVVRDTGMGMSPETRARIFDPFFSTKYTGRGLGLAAVLGIVRAHGGAIWVESEIGRGTTFTMALPLNEHAKSVTLASLPDNERWKTSGQALIVDDEDSVLQVSAQMVRLLGLEPQTLNDGAAARDALTSGERSYDFVLLDLEMPECDGAELIPIIRESQPQAVTIIMTGFNEKDARSRLEASPPDAFIQKPFTLNQLRDRLKLTWRRDDHV